ncbi:MAG: hypothetical protein DHS20C02_12390 [Micavibrio sp.]|nr:MAG: hypothetical protein DHS20C02_12390 [Micavibrio sp.]
MATFDFIEAASKSYKFLWIERQVIARLAFPAIIIRFISYILITTFGLEENFLRQGLILLPAYFAEAWLLAYLIRCALYNEDLPFRAPSLKKKLGPANPERYRFMRAGIAVYVLTWTILSCVNGMAMRSVVNGVEEIPEPTLEAYLVGMAAFAFGMWLFRLIWLYVPMVMGYSIVGFMRRIRGYTISLYMVGAWLICYVPFILLLMLFSDMALIAFPSETDGPSVAYKYVMAAAEIIANMASTIVVTITIAYGVESIMNAGDEKK